MKLTYDSENGLWLLNGWAFEQTGGFCTIKRWEARKENLFFWARTRKQAIEYANIIDKGGNIPEINLKPLY